MFFGLSMWEYAATAIGLVVAVVVVGVVAGNLGGAGKRNLEKQRGSSRAWARSRDLKALRGDAGDPQRLPLCKAEGKALYLPRYRSLTVISPSGAGKTTRVVVPIVLTHPGPAVVASVKGDVLALTRHHREKSGQVWVFDPSESTGPTVRWSPLGHIAAWADALDAARWIQESQKADGSGGIQDRQFWDAQARFLLAPLLWWAACTERPIGAVFNALQDSPDMIALISDELYEIGDPNAVTYWQHAQDLEPRTRASVLTTARSVLEAWVHPRVQAAVSVRTGEPSLDLDLLLEGNHTLYLVAPASEQSMFTAIYESLVNAVLMKVERAAQARGGVPIERPLLLMLDEAANIAPLRHLDAVASKAAGEGVLLVTAWQDVGQIETIYGESRARTILSNHFGRLYLPGITDDRTLEQLSRAIGRDVFEFTSTSTSSGQYGSSISTSQHETDIAPPAWLRQLPPDQAVAIVSRFPPILGSAVPWYEDRRLRAKVDPTVAEHFDRAFAQPRKRSRSAVTS